MASQSELPTFRARVLVADNLAGGGVGLLRAAAGFEVEELASPDPATLAARIAEADGLIVRSATRVTADLLASAARLRVVGRAGVGVDHIDLEAATARGVVVMNTPGGNAVSAAEHTISLLLSLAKHIPQASASMKAGRWEKGRFVSTEVSGKVLGLVGLGRIGSEVAKRAKGLALRVLVYDPYVSAERAEALGVELVELSDLFREADFLSLHTPLTPETANLVSAASIARMKDGVRIVNCARGGLVHEGDLYDALACGKVAGAALDVFEKEPITDSPLFALPNFISTPHLGAASGEAQEAVALEIAQQMIDYLSRGIIRNAVNAPSVPAELMRELAPYLTLGEKLGLLVAQLAEGRLAEIRVAFRGEIAALDCAPLAAVTVQGVLAPFHDSVNMVNALAIARGRGIHVVESKTTAQADFANVISVALRTDQGQVTAAGSLYGRREPRLVEIDGLRMEAVLEGLLLVYANLDVPGVIGRIGTLLGKHNVNIAGMQLGRQRRGGHAISAVNVDDPIPVPVLDEIRRLPNIVYAKLIRL